MKLRVFYQTRSIAHSRLANEFGFVPICRYAVVVVTTGIRFDS
jgi:hypothetical protein